MGLMILILGLLCLLIGARLTRPVEPEVKQGIWKDLSRVEKNRLADKFDLADRVDRVWPDDYTKPEPPKRWPNV